MLDQPSSPSSFRYDVFISYRRLPDDERWARWLQEAIETFQTPPALVQKGFAPHLGRAFVDDTEMAASAELSRAIKTALWESRWLIVICSPDTPRSDWVRQEISLFRNAWRRKERTLALIVAGTPAQSFPPELREFRMVGDGPDTTTEVVEPAGASVLEAQDKTEAELKSLALDKFAAALLGCDLGELRDRQHERVQRETSHRYFHDMIERRGVPLGIGEISQETQRRRSTTYRFAYRGGVVRTVERINGRGMPAEDDDKICRVDVAYRGDGSVEAVDRRNARGDTKLRLQFSRDATIVDFFHDDQSASAASGAGSRLAVTEQAFDKLKKQKTRIVRHLIDYDAGGFATRVRYCGDGFNTPAQDALGCFGETHERNDAGQQIAIGFLDANGERISLSNGVAARRFTYDELGRLIRNETFDAASRPILDSDGVAALTWAYDENGNLVEEMNYDASGQPTADRRGIIRLVSVFDDRGALASMKYLDPTGAPAVDDVGLHLCRVVTDERGYPTDHLFFDVDLKPAFTTRGSHRISRVRGPLGEFLEECHYDAHGFRTVDEFGVGIHRFDLDDRGNVVVCRCFDIDGNLTLHRDGWSTQKLAYNQRGQMVEFASFDASGQPTSSKAGYHRLATSFDARGNEIEQRRFGPDLSLSPGIAIELFEHDPQGNMTRLSYFGPDGEPTAENFGVATFLLSYDRRGKEIERRFLDGEGQPVLCRDGYARQTSTWDERGNLAEQAWYADDGAPTGVGRGYARLTRLYDARGNTIEERYYDGDGLPTLADDGVACIRIEYDLRGKPTRMDNFGVEGARKLSSQGFARIDMRYDRAGNVIERAFFGVDLAPVVTTGGARTRLCYDARNNLIEQVLLDAAGELLEDEGGRARQIRRFDKRNRLTESLVYRADGDLARLDDGSCGWRQAYDGRGNMVEMSRLDRDLVPAVFDGKPAIERIRYDANDRYVSVRYFDGDQNPMLDARGLAGFDSEYDTFGNRVRSVIVGLDDRPIVGSEGFCESRAQWDRFSRRSGRAYFGLEGEPIDRFDGYHRVEFHRDLAGRLTHKVFFDSAGETTHPPEIDNEPADDA